MTEDERLSGLERVGGSSAGGYYRLGPSIIVAVPHPGYQQTVEGAESSLAEFDRIARQSGHKHAVIVMVNRVTTQSASARRVWARPRERETRCCQALVCSTLLARAIGSFFLGLTRPAIPTQMFATLDRAQAWAEKLVETHGGPIAD